MVVSCRNKNPRAASVSGKHLAKVISVQKKEVKSGSGETLFLLVGYNAVSLKTCKQCKNSRLDFQ